MHRTFSTSLVAAASFVAACSATAEPVVGNLQARYQGGQVFLTWTEAAVPAGTTFAVYSATAAITPENLAQATLVCEHIGPHSAQDWWLNPETFGNPVPPDPATGKKPAYPIQGFVLDPAAQPLAANGGLHVHTVVAGEEGLRFYAVLARASEGQVEAAVPGVNATQAGVDQTCAPSEPIWQHGDKPAPDPAKAKGLPLFLVLHAKTGHYGMDYLAFGDASLGWREGLPFKFEVTVAADRVWVRPTDRAWIERFLEEGTDSCEKITPAIHSFWYGYNSMVYDKSKTSQGVATNYTERRLLWLVAWVQRHFQTDPNRVYLSGSSMGGCGSISFGMRHPEIFATIQAHVPIVAYRDPDPQNFQRDSAVRVRGTCGKLSMPTSDGMTLGERLDGLKWVRETPGELPFLVITQGRTDMSIPWRPNPDYYRLLDAGKHGFVAIWDNGDHAGCMKDASPAVKRWTDVSYVLRFALNKSYPAFSGCSTDNDPGNGDPANGDLVGAMNLGFDWDDAVDQAARYEVLVKWVLPEAQFPVTADVTPRRVQAFKLPPGTVCVGKNVEVETGREVQTQNLKADANGLVTFPAFRITSAKGNRLVLESGAGK